jgi:hypothetical protein
MSQEVEHEHEHKHERTYFVNGERETTHEHELTVRGILEGAGFTPATDYTLKSERPPEDFDSHYDKLVKIHEDQRFQALHKGPTPTS